MNKELSKLKKEMQAARSAYYNKAREVLDSQVAKLFTEYPGLKEFRLGVSNHEWNDGDTTAFYVNFDEPQINGYEVDEFPNNFDEEGDEEEFGITKEVAEEISTKIYNIFDAVEDELEYFYGDEGYHITFTRDNVESN